MGICLGSKEKEAGCDEKIEETSPKQTPKREERGNPLPGESHCSQPRPRHPGDLFWLSPIHLQGNRYCQLEKGFVSLFYLYVPFSV